MPVASAGISSQNSAKPERGIETDERGFFVPGNFMSEQR